MALSVLRQRRHPTSPNVLMTNSFIFIWTHVPRINRSWVISNTPSCAMLIQYPLLCRSPVCVCGHVDRRLSYVLCHAHITRVEKTRQSICLFRKLNKNSVINLALISFSIFKANRKTWRHPFVWAWRRMTRVAISTRNIWRRSWLSRQRVNEMNAERAKNPIMSWSLHRSTAGQSIEFVVSISRGIPSDRMVFSQSFPANDSHSSWYRSGESATDRTSPTIALSANECSIQLSNTILVQLVRPTC